MGSGRTLSDRRAGTSSSSSSSLDAAVCARLFFIWLPDRPGCSISLPLLLPPSRPSSPELPCSSRCCSRALAASSPGSASSPSDDESRPSEMVPSPLDCFEPARGGRCGRACDGDEAAARGGRPLSETWPVECNLSVACFICSLDVLGECGAPWAGWRVSREVG